MGNRRLWRAALATLVIAGACSSDEESSGPADATTTIAGDAGSATYRATITRTAGGVPHIVGPDRPSVTFGQGWASAGDHACSLADQILKVFSRRAEFLGPGADDENITSDFAWLNIGLAELAAGEWPEVSADTRELITAYADGWNAYLADTGVDDLAGWCAGAKWVRPIEPVELYTYARSIALNASSNRLISFIGGAQPPTAETPGTALPLIRRPAEPPPDLGSNGWAVGAERTEDGTTMLLANPHFPWEGELRFWEVHLQIEGGTSMYGAQLTGLPGVGIGFGDGVAWTHTVSAGNRFTAYTLDLVDGDPTSYLYDGEPRAMEATEATIEVLGEDGKLTEQSRTLYRSHYGPVLDFPGVGWTADTTITYRDANIDNDELVDQFAAMNQAENLDDLVAAHRDHQGVPLFNTIAAGADGEVWYADTSATPNLSPEALAAYEERLANDPLTSTAAASNAVLLDGSTSRDEWVDAPGARDPGLVPFDAMPQTTRSDYVFNANDSFWLANGTALIEGEYSPLHGRQRTERSPRTRQNLAVLDPTDEMSPAGEGGLFDLDELRSAALDDTAFTAAVLADELVVRCTASPTIDVPETVDEDGAVALPAETVELSQACSVLGSWDRRFDVDSRGAVIWREFIGRLGRQKLWAVPFDDNAPLETPRGLGGAPAGVGPDEALVALGRAVQILNKNGVALDATLGSLQVDGRQSDIAIPIPGGTGAEGVTNVVGYSSTNSSTSESPPARPEPVIDGSALTPEGYWINNGTSILMAVEFTDAGPRAYTILTYGQTGDRTSRWFTEQTEMFSRKEWKRVPLSAQEITRDAIGDPVTVTG